MTIPDCPSNEELERFLVGDVAPNRAEVVGRHVDACSTCEMRLAWLERTMDDPLLERLRHTGTGTVLPGDEPTVLETIRRLEAAPPGTMRHGTPLPEASGPSRPGLRVAVLLLAALAVGAAAYLLGVLGR